VISTKYWYITHPLPQAPGFYGPPSGHNSSPRASAQTPGARETIPGKGWAKSDSKAFGRLHCSRPKEKSSSPDLIYLFHFSIGIFLPFSYSLNFLLQYCVTLCHSARTARVEKDWTRKRRQLQQDGRFLPTLLQ
jgi:hypothetical protein